MKFILSKYVTSELNRISFLIKLAYYEKILPKSTASTGKIRKMIDEAKVDWEDITWVNIKTKPRALGKEDIIGDFEEGLLSRTGPSIYDNPNDPKKRISFELHGKLHSSGFPIKLQVLRGSGSNESVKYTIFIKLAQDEFKELGHTTNTAQMSKYIENIYEKLKDKKELSDGELDEDSKSYLEDLLKAIKEKSKPKQISSFLIKKYEENKNKKSPYLFDLTVNFYKNKKYIDFNFKPILEDNQSRDSEYEKEILEEFEKYVSSIASDKKIDLNNFNIDLKTESKTFYLKIKDKK